MTIEQDSAKKRALKSLLDQYSPEEIREAMAYFREQKQEWADRIQESLEVFPFSLDQVKAMTATKNVAWLHPLTQISHGLLKHFNVVDEPHMLLSSDKDKASGRTKQSGCHCFYATVTYDDHGITVYDNFGMGGMCPEEPQYIAAYMPLPEWMAPHMKHLHEMAETAMAQPHADYDPPIPNYDWRQPEKKKAIAPDPYPEYAP